MSVEVSRTGGCRAGLGAGAAGGLATGAVSRGALAGMASKDLPVALAGGVGFGSFNTLKSARPGLQQTSKKFGQAMKLFFQPFGNAMDTHLRPMAPDMNNMAPKFNQIANEKSLPVAIVQMSADVGTSIGKGIDEELSEPRGRPSAAPRQRESRRISECFTFDLVQKVFGLSLGGAGHPLGTITFTEWFAIDEDIGRVIKEDRPGWPDIKVTWLGWPTDALNSFIRPTLPDFSWPTLPNFTWPRLPTFSWPSLPGFSWPDIRLPDIADWSDLAPDLPRWRDLQPTVPESSFLQPAVPNWSTLKPGVPDWTTLSPGVPDWSTLTPPLPDW